MAKKAASHIHVTDEEHGSVVFAPGDEVPSWAEKLITAPNVYEGDEADKPAEGDEPDKPKRR